MAYVCYAKWRHYPQRFYDLLSGEVMHHWRKGNCEGIIKERDKHRQQQGGKGFLPLPTGIMLPCTSFSTRKGIGIHKDFCRQPQIAAGRHILPSVSYHCSPVQCNTCNCLFLLLNSLRLCSYYITKKNIFLEKLWTLVCHFLSQLRRSQYSFWSFGRYALGLFMCHWLTRRRQSSWGSRLLDH